MVATRHSNPHSPNATDAQQSGPWAEDELTSRYAPDQLRALSSAHASRAVERGPQSTPAPRRHVRHDSQATPTPRPTRVRLTSQRPQVSARPAAIGGEATRLAPPIPLAALASPRPAAPAPSAGLEPEPSRELFMPPLAATSFDPLGLELPELVRDPRTWMGNTQRALALVVITGCCTLLALLYFGGFLP